MGKFRKKRRQMKIAQRKKRRQKLAKLRKAYKEVKYSHEKEKIWEKVLKIAPWLKKEEFLPSPKKEEKTD